LFDGSEIIKKAGQISSRDNFQGMLVFTVGFETTLQNYKAVSLNSALFIWEILGWRDTYHYKIRLVDSQQNTTCCCCGTEAGSSVIFFPFFKQEFPAHFRIRYERRLQYSSHLQLRYVPHRRDIITNQRNYRRGEMVESTIR
jgi:hypothetical protein